MQNDLEYVVPVTIGTPGVTLNLASPRSIFVLLPKLIDSYQDFDTGQLPHFYAKIF